MTAAVAWRRSRSATFRTRLSGSSNPTGTRCGKLRAMKSSSTNMPATRTCAGGSSVSRDKQLACPGRWRFPQDKGQASCLSLQDIAQPCHLQSIAQKTISGRTEKPVLGVACEAGFHRVCRDVLHDAFQFFIIADPMIIGFVLPELARPFE